MLKKFILCLCIIISFIATALFFTWKPLLISTLNQSLARPNTPIKIAVIAIDGLKLNSNKLQIATLQLTVNGHLQTFKAIEILGQLTQGKIKQVNMQQLMLDVPELPPSAEADTHNSNRQHAFSVENISSQLQALLSVFQADFQLTIAKINLRQFKLATSRFALHIPNKQLITMQWQLGQLRLQSQLSLSDSSVEQHNLLEDLSDKNTTTILWQQDNHCQDSDNAVVCTINGEIDMQQLALLSQQADLAAIARQKFSPEAWQTIQHTLQQSQGHGSIQALIQLPFVANSDAQPQATLTLNSTEDIKLSMAALLPKSPLHSLLIQQDQALTLHWQDGQLQQTQAKLFNFTLIDKQQQALPLRVSAENSVCDNTLNCRGNMQIKSAWDYKSSKKHSLLKTALKDMHWQQWRMNPSLQWQLDQSHLTMTFADMASLSIKKLRLLDNSVNKLVIKPQALKLVYAFKSNNLQVTAKAVHVDAYTYSHPQMKLSAINLQLKDLQLQYHKHKLSGHSQLLSFLKQPQLNDNNKLGNIRLTGPIVLNTQQLAFSLAIKHADNRLLQLQGQHDIATQSGHSTWHIPALEITASKPLHSLIGLNSFPVWISQGTLQASGQAHWGDNTQLAGRLDFEGVNGSFDQYHFQGLQGAMMLQAEDNNVSYASFGKISVDEVNLGIAIKALNLSMHGRSDDNIIHINDFKAKLLDGELGLDAYQFDLNNDLHKGLLKLENLSLAEVIKIADTPGLSGSGSLNGRLPFVISGSDFTIHQGLLYSTPPGGLIHYKDDNMADANAAMSYIYKALGNYHYTQMISTIDLTKQGKLILGVSMRGNNPDFENGRAIHLNLNLDDDIMQQMRSLNAIDKVTDKVEKHYQ